MAAALWMTEMPMAGTGTCARPWSCASASTPVSGAAAARPMAGHHSHGSYVGVFAAKAVKQDAIRLLIDATVRPTGTPGGSTG